MAAIMLMMAVVFTGCHKDPQNGGDDNGGNGGGNGGGGGTPTETTYTVTFDANGGTGTMQPQIFNKGEARALTPNSFTRENYIFAGWNTRNDGSGTAYSDKQSITVSQDMVLYAQWKTTVIITFKANGGSGEMEPQTFHIGVPQALNANTYTRMNHVFAGWNTAGDGSGTNYINGQEITVSEDLALYAQWQIVPQGAIGGLFSVSETKQVFFSQGNLQYRASTNTWRFAESQLDYIGGNNGNISSSYSGWIDLFGWGTGNNPTNSSTSNSSYSSFTDWGSKPISNGGNQANLWRTLTKDEWSYLLNTRSTNSGIRYAKATVNGVTGVIILPDDWSTSYYTLSSTNSGGASFTSNTINSADWASSLEAHGAVFLPAAGYRYGTSVYDVGSDGRYWSSSYGSGSAYDLCFYGSGLYMYNDDRYRGRSVRLVAEE